MVDDVLEEIGQTSIELRLSTGQSANELLIKRYKDFDPKTHHTRISGQPPSGRNANAFEIQLKLAGGFVTICG